MDSAADYIFQAERANLAYPPPFGRDATAEEAKIMEMDSKTGASLKVCKQMPKSWFDGIFAKKASQIIWIWYWII